VRAPRLSADLSAGFGPQPVIERPGLVFQLADSETITQGTEILVIPLGASHRRNPRFR